MDILFSYIRSLPNADAFNWAAFSILWSWNQKIIYIYIYANIRWQVYKSLCSCSRWIVIWERSQIQIWYDIWLAGNSDWFTWSKTQGPIWHPPPPPPPQKKKKKKKDKKEKQNKTKTKQKQQQNRTKQKHNCCLWWISRLHHASTYSAVILTERFPAFVRNVSFW